MKSKIMGHRGSREHFLENTLNSFEALKKTPAHAVEFDVHMTKDGHWIVHHDESFERLTHSKLKISDCALKDLETIFHPDGQKIPTLKEVLNIFLGTDFELQIEIKSMGNFNELINTCQKYSAIENLTFISFNHKILKNLKPINPLLKTACLFYGLPVNPLDLILSANSNGLSLNVNLIDNEIVKVCHDHNFKVTAWNANDKETFLKMRELGVDYIGTDKTIEIFSWMEN